MLFCSSKCPLLVIYTAEHYNIKMTHKSIQTPPPHFRPCQWQTRVELLQHFITMVFYGQMYNISL